jgi:hypothetical protein
VYSTCLFCHSNLGANESVEQFPIGRRLAFDEAKGRLWVVCRKCERWNLSPIEERWEAIDECERLFRGTRLRVSTDNIGLARVAEGLELVRIGSALRPEMAAWRYGDQFGRRRRKNLVLTGAGVAAVAGFVIVGPATGIIAGSSWGLWNVASTAHNLYQQRRVRARIVIPDQQDPVGIRLKQLSKAAIVPDGDDWALRVAFEAGQPESVFGVPARWATRVNGGNEVSTLIRGDAALRAAGKLLPAINRSGARRGAVAEAVRIIGGVSEPSELFGRYATQDVRLAKRRPAFAIPSGHVLANLPTEVRLALEMASHEESERRALDGELAMLETAWKEAEEIAAIADDMFVPDETRARLSALKSSNDPTS